MKASQLIIELTKMIANHGDKDLVVAAAPAVAPGFTSASEDYYSVLSVSNGGGEFGGEFEIYGEQL